MKSIPDVLQALHNEFGIDPSQITDIESRIDFEDIPLSACKHAIAVMHGYKAKGTITHPKGLFFKIAKDPKSNHATQTATKPTANNPMTGDGYDFWCGARNASEQTCELIMWNYNSDDPDDKAMAIDLMIECAPCLNGDDEIIRAIEYADSEHTVGSWPIRLAQAVEKTIRYRNRTISDKTVEKLVKTTGVPLNDTDSEPDIPTDTSTELDL